MSRAHSVSAMTYNLHQGLHVCEVEGRAVLLDLPNDRYSVLNMRLSRPLLDFVTGLPVAADHMHELTIKGFLDAAAGLEAVRPLRVRTPKGRYAVPRNAGLSIFPTAAALYRIKRAMAARRCVALDRILSKLTKLKIDLPPLLDPTDRRAARLLLGFENSRYWIAPGDLCLPRSIALADALLRHRIDATLVIGVRLEPFRAHCWVQSADVVLNDTVEEVLKFTPILSI